MPFPYSKKKYRVEKETSYDEIVAAIQAAADNGMKGIVKVTDEPLVSSDFNTTTFSSTLDVKAGIELNPTFFKRKKFETEI